MTSPSGTKQMSGWVMFAAAFMMILGVFNILYGLIIIFNDDFPVLSAAGAVAVDLRLWGWVIIAIGFLEASAGTSIMMGRSWARIFGIFVGAFGVISAMLYFPIYPWWGLFGIIVNSGVVYGLTVHGGEIGYRPPTR